MEAVISCIHDGWATAGIAFLQAVPKPYKDTATDSYKQRLRLQQTQPLPDAAILTA
jgi:hypothetical protein